MSFQPRLPSLNPPLQARLNQRPGFSCAMASTLGAEGMVTRVSERQWEEILVLVAPSSPAVIMLPQAQLNSIRSMGMICFLKDSGRVPGQAGPALGVSVGLSSV